MNYPPSPLRGSSGRHPRQLRRCPLPPVTTGKRCGAKLAGGWRRREFLSRLGCWGSVSQARHGVVTTARWPRPSAALLPSGGFQVARCAVAWWHYAAPDSVVWIATAAASDPGDTALGVLCGVSQATASGLLHGRTAQHRQGCVDRDDNGFGSRRHDIKHALWRLPSDAGREGSTQAQCSGREARCRSGGCVLLI